MVLGFFCNTRNRFRVGTGFQVPLCGHATLAASHFVFESGLVDCNSVEFSTLSGVLTANRIPANEINDSEHGFYIELDFPVGTVSVFKDVEVSVVSEMLNGVSVVDVLMKNAFDDIVVVLSSAEEVADFKPQFDKIKEGPGRAVIITARAPDGSGFDFYSRVFGPKIGVDEDPVCGSAHCALALYWHEKLGKCDFVAYQASSRSGILHVHLDKENQRVRIRGKATTIMEGSLLV
ncbi:putative phenazine biosynthesis PhzF protein [Helianthus debilis subsp. tardiflorus]